jgi:hypothetical protein
MLKTKSINNGKFINVLFYFYFINKKGLCGYCKRRLKDTEDNCLTRLPCFERHVKPLVSVATPIRTGVMARSSYV